MGIDILWGDSRRSRPADAQPAWGRSATIHDRGDVRSTIGPLQCAHSSAWIEHRATDPGAGVQILLGAFFLAAGQSRAYDSTRCRAPCVPTSSNRTAGTYTSTATSNPCPPAIALPPCPTASTSGAG